MERETPAPVIGISISESPDLPRMGLGDPHLREATVEIARYLLRAGYSLAYGGDLRAGGFTRDLFELVRSYRTDAPETLPVMNYLAWPVHRTLTDSQLDEIESEFTGGGILLLLDPQGQPMSREERREALSRHLADDWAQGLTAMRKTMARDCAARLLLGGKVKGYSGAAPGLAEEALLILRAGKPLYLAGGFGGCACDVAAALGWGWAPERSPGEVGPGYRETLQLLQEESSRRKPENGLSQDENVLLAETQRVPVILKLVLRGLSRLAPVPEPAS
ncbi:MAG: hypothetical protein QOF89_5378 [Acidobacteriota bacterium]|nr:hypothetical protein [Acidobacteriota bacterium]